MLEPRAGDIILVRGRSSRYKLTRIVLGCEWNHAVVYYKDGEVQELNWNGTQRKSFDDVYRNKQIVVLRLQPTDSLDRLRREAAFIYALDKLQGVNFDWREYVRRCLHLKPRDLPNKSVCDAYINRVYYGAQYVLNKAGMTTTPIDCIDLMRKDYGGRELLRKHNLIKIYDYRDHLVDAQ